MDPAKPAANAIAPNRLRYARRAGKIHFEEEWTSGQPGFEQSFTVSERPCKGRELVIEVAAEGLTPALRDGQEQGEGGAVELRDGAGTVRLRYSELYAYDASGGVLPAAMRVTGERIALHVDTADAKWPVVVDPLVVVEEAELSLEFGKAGDRVGTQVAFDGDTALVAAPGRDVGPNSYQGAAYVFVRQGTAWTWLTTLVASDGAAGDFFGNSVALSSDTALVGAPGYKVDGKAYQEGAVYVFVRSGSSWSQQAVIFGRADARDDNFGSSVALSGDAALVGTPGASIDGNKSQGAAYVFVRSGSSWSQQAMLSGSDGADSDFFGSSVALNGDTALVGAPFHEVDGKWGQGSAYVFVRSGSSWSQQAMLSGSDGAIADHFGTSVALSGYTALVGAPNHYVDGSEKQGSAYVFVRSGSSWSQQAMLSGSDGADSDSFGTSVALSGDTALVGAPRHGVDGKGWQGSAYVFVRFDSSWSQQAMLSGSDGANSDFFGTSVALSGDTALVGAPFHEVDGHDEQGSAYALIRSGGDWVEQAMLSGSGGAPDGIFGISIALSGDTAVVGVPLHDVDGKLDQGAAYVFVRSAGNWVEQTMFSSSDGAGNDNFGTSVALSGDTALVGAPNHYVHGNGYQGAAYVFVHSRNGWAEQAMLSGSDGASVDFFGTSVALNGDTALVGAPFHEVDGKWGQGSAYVFVRSGSSWSQQAMLSGSDGADSDSFGTSVALSGDTALVGAPRHGVDGKGWQGSAYIFVRSGGNWVEQVMLSGSDGADRDFFGTSVALSGDTALIGAPYHKVEGNWDQGSAYIFVRSGGNWVEQAVLSGSDGANGDFFGNRVALSGDTALVGAPGHGVDGKAYQGSAYVFVRSGSSWAEQTTLSSGDGAASDGFGGSVALSGDTTVVGAPSHDVGANTDQGAVYVFHLHGVAGGRCNFNDDCASPYFCVDGVCCTTECTGTCEVCSGALGATRDGTCTPKPAGTVGDPVCTNNIQCNGSSGACPVGCTTDAQCPSGTFCAWVACQSKKPVATTCVNSNECATPGGCVDGVCCNEPCSGSCEACRADLSTGQTGVCSPALPGATGSPACVGNVLCDGLSRACPGQCTLDAHCPSNQYCDSTTGLCQPKNPMGVACATSNECSTLGGCVDHVCCNSPCTGLCQACSAATKETGIDGECGNAKRGTDPHDQCSQDSPTSCGQSGSCNGNGACSLYDTTTACGTPVCHGNESRPRVCVGPLDCNESAAGTDCDKYRCNPSTGVCLAACLTDQDCTSANYCDPETSLCVAKKADGQPCGGNSQCGSRHCVDDVCCESDCSGQCKWCGNPETPGRCLMVTEGQPRGDRIACPGAGKTCGGYCNGSQGDGCSFPSLGTACGMSARCEGDFKRSAGSCDGAGECLPSALSACDNDFTCDAKTSTCKTSCSTSADCRQGAVCDNSEAVGYCNAQGVECVGSFLIKSVEGAVNPCPGGYACSNGACQQQCGGDRDCDQAHRCEDHACAMRVGASSAIPDGDIAGGGCGCRLGGRPPRPAIPVLLITLVAASWAARRRLARLARR